MLLALGLGILASRELGLGILASRELGLGILCHDDPVGVGRPGAVVVSIGVGVARPAAAVVGS